MATSVPTWAQAEVANVIPSEEQVQFVGAWRLDVVPPNGLLSANGLQVECESGTSRIVNGLNKATLADAASIIR